MSMMQHDLPQTGPAIAGGSTGMHAGLIPPLPSMQGPSPAAIPTGSMSGLSAALRDLRRGLEEVTRFIASPVTPRSPRAIAIDRAIEEMFNGDASK